MNAANLAPGAAPSGVRLLTPLFSLYHSRQMGFALWVDDELAWAAGTYEYRPLGAAVISNTQLFRERDFSRRARVPSVEPERYAGQFASIGHMNQFLLKRRARTRR